MPISIDFYGHRVNQGRVLYIAAEGDEYHIAERIYAWCEQHGLDMDDLTGRPKIVYSSVRLNDKEQLSQFVHDVEQQCPGKWDLVFLDTLTKNMVGDQSKQDVMADFFARVDAMRRRF